MDIIFVEWNGQKRRKYCFICGKEVKRSKEWKEDYCRCHEGCYRNNCGGSRDWGLIMEHLEQGYLTRI